MIKETITYVDFNGNQLTEDFRFHLSTPEVMSITARVGTDLDKYVQKLKVELDGMKIMEMMQMLMLESYGELNADGRFYKTPEIRQKFEYSNAYPVLFEKLFNDPEMTTRFASGLAATASPQDGQPTSNVAVAPIMQSQQVMNSN